MMDQADKYILKQFIGGVFILLLLIVAGGFFFVFLTHFGRLCLLLAGY